MQLAEAICVHLYKKVYHSYLNCGDTSEPPTMRVVGLPVALNASARAMDPEREEKGYAHVNSVGGIDIADDRRERTGPRVGRTQDAHRDARARERAVETRTTHGGGSGLRQQPEIRGDGRANV